MRKTIFLFLLLWTCVLTAQTPVKIDLVHDDNPGSELFLQQVRAEMNILLGQRYELQINDLPVSTNDLPQAISTVQESLQSNSDMVIALGLFSSSILSQVGTYPKPSIAGIALLDAEKEVSGIDNFSYITSPFSIDQDIATFKTIYDFKHLAVFVEPGFKQFVESFMNQYRTDFDIQFVTLTDDPQKDIASINSNVDAVYYLPTSYGSEEKDQQLIDGVNAQKLASFSLLGRQYVESGTLASLSSDDNLQAYARRLAINTMKVIEGQNPKDFPVKLKGIQNEFVINLQTMRQIGVYPPLEVLAKATLINPIVAEGRNLTLSGAIARALEQNINFQGQKKGIDIQSKEVGIAQSNILPQVTASSSLSSIDQNTAELLAGANQTTPQTQWAGNLQLTQVIYSEPALANIAIQKMLTEAQVAEVEANQLDLVLDVGISYLSYLLAVRNLEIQTENVEISQKNLNIAKNSVEIGARSQSDVFGFESQLASNKSSFYDAMNQLEQAKISLNTLLNFPINDDLVLQDIDSTEYIIFAMDNRISGQVQSQRDIQSFNDYSINYAMQNLPSLQQLQWNIQAIDRQLLSNKRSIYLPQLSFQANVDQTFGRYGTRAPDESFEAFGFDPYNPTYSLGGAISLPLFQGNLRRRRIEQSQLSLEQLVISNDNAKLQVRSNIQSSLQNLSNSYNQLLFAQQSATASIKFLDNVQRLYTEGTTNINTLLDAQNNALFARLSAASAQYNLFIDALILERSTGLMYITSTPSQRDQFINGFLQQMK